MSNICEILIHFRKIGSIVATLTLLSIGELFAQQNLFNIPSGDVNEKNEFFYQHQFNIYSDKLESKAHFIFGIGKGWDIGLNIVGKGAYFSPEWRISHNDDPDEGSLYPFVMPTIQKQFEISEHFSVNLGSQVGVNVSSKIENKEIGYFNYGIGTYHFMHERSRIVGGLYQTNKMFVGQGNTFGVLLGYEIKLSKSFYLMGDWLSGNNDSAAGVIGGMYNLTKRIQICAGALIPNPNTPKPYGLVLELNFMTWDVK